MIHSNAYLIVLDLLVPHGMCLPHFGNGVRNGAISITQRGFINDYYKGNTIGQWGKIMITGIGFAHTVEQYLAEADIFARLSLQ